MSPIDDHYPISCPFCKISEAFPAEGASSPIPQDPDPEKCDPQCHLILSAPNVLAFLDIMPIAPGHILLTTRQHYQKVSDLYTSTAGQQGRESARDIGEWLPLVSQALCKATGIEDWNVVQNNGERAAQVVPHVHFHLIPRYQEGRRGVGGKGKVDVGMLKSWRMFGRGTREDLDDDEGKELARRLRECLAEVVKGVEGVKSKM